MINCRPSIISPIQIVEAYEKAKPNFQKSKCKVCKTQELSHSWDIDLASMAEKVGGEIATLYLAAYANPVLEAHATFASAMSRTYSHGEKFIYDHSPSTTSIDSSIFHAFALMYFLLDMVNGRFSLPFQEQLDELAKLTSKAL
ncbi:MAG TPA: hypothetical protein VHZ55_30975 [Bryobacteraceae bacterium]|jgi:hypothetical protein|nr:hypothetical protein [Bryobacteraceae bacterium]